jgi:hypothetical protein
VAAAAAADDVRERGPVAVGRRDQALVAGVAGDAQVRERIAGPAGGAGVVVGGMQERAL